MRDPFANYDAWLEAPYQRACEEQANWERAAEALGLTEEEFESGEYDADIEEWLESEAWEIEEARGQALAEARAEAMADWDR